MRVVVCCSMLQCVAVCCCLVRVSFGKVSSRVAVCCSVWQCGAVCSSVLHCVAACCNVLQCVAVCCSVFLPHESVIRQSQFADIFKSQLASKIL